MRSLAQPCSVNNTFFSLWEGQKWGFSLRIAHIAPSLCFCTKGIFFGWSQRDWMHLGPLCMQLRAPISFFLLFGANSSPWKSAALFSIAKFDKNSTKWNVFGAATGSGVLLCWGRCTKTSTFLRDPPHPSQNWNFHLIDKIADFLHNKLFFLIAPRDLHYYWASAQPCADRLRR